jgi:GT2 family glycosyltransferase
MGMSRESMTSLLPAPPAPVVVLMPVFNANREAWRTMASFVEPDWPSIAFLIVDDGSQPPFDPRARPATVPACITVDVLTMPHNVGIERALAAGVEHLLSCSPGIDYIARIDAGDLAYPSRLTKQRHYLDTHPHVGAVGMWAQGMRRIPHPGHPGGTAETTGARNADGPDTRNDSNDPDDPDASTWIPDFVLAPPCEPAVIRRQRFFRSCFIHPAMMLRSDAIRRAGNYRPDYPAAEDLDLFLRIMADSDCANLPEIGIAYQLNDGGISATRRARQIDSTWRLQLRYFDAANLFDWLGLLKNGLHRIVPYAMLQRVKRYLI